MENAFYTLVGIFFVWELIVLTNPRWAMYFEKAADKAMLVYKEDKTKPLPINISTYFIGNGLYWIVIAIGLFFSYEWPLFLCIIVISRAKKTSVAWAITDAAISATLLLCILVAHIGVSRPLGQIIIDALCPSLG